VIRLERMQDSGSATKPDDEGRRRVLAAPTDKIFTVGPTVQPRLRKHWWQTAKNSGESGKSDRLVVRP